MRSETGTVYDHVQPMRTQSIARIEIQDAKDRLREQEAEEQSEREVCDPGLFARAGSMARALADAEEGFFSDAFGLSET